MLWRVSKFITLIIFSDKLYEIRYFSFKIYIRKSCFLWFNWFRVFFFWKITVWLCMNFYKNYLSSEKCWMMTGFVSWVYGRLRYLFFQSICSATCVVVMSSWIFEGIVAVWMGLDCTHLFIIKLHRTFYVPICVNHLFLSL